MSSSRTIAWSVSTKTHPDPLNQYLRAMADMFEVTGISDHDRVHFHNSSRATLSQSGIVGSGRCVGQTLTRSPQLLKRSSTDGLTLFVNATATYGECEGRAFNAPPACLQFRDLTRPSKTHFETVDANIIMVPRHLLPEELTVAAIHGLCLSPDRADVRLLSAQMANLIDESEGLPESVLAAAVQSLLVIASRMIGSSTDGGAASNSIGVQTAVRAAAGQYIEHSLQAGAALLDFRAMLKFVGVSRATLYRAFNGEGGVRRYIQDRRLHHARTALVNRRHSKPTIAHISEDYGFASPSHFSRLFRRKYGLSPSEVESIAAFEHDTAPQSVLRHEMLGNWLDDIQLR